MKPRSVLLFVLLAFAGCGHTTKATPATTPFVCHPRQPAQMGECVRQELEYNGIAPAAPKVGATFGGAAHAQGIDISRYQPHPAFRELYRQGIRFVIVQGADNAYASNPFFASQVREAHEAGMQVGVYIFAEGDSSTAQANTLIAVAASERKRITLGAYVDAEVGSAYPRSCGIASVLAHHFHIVGVYGSPGTYGGGHCIGVIWPAEWGRGSAYALPGYPSSAIKLRQWCGTCTLAGNDGEIDRDEDLGLLALAHQKPEPSRIVLLHRRAVIRTLLTKHRCRPPLHAKPKSYHTVCGYWLREGAHINRQLKGSA